MDIDVKVALTLKIIDVTNSYNNKDACESIATCIRDDRFLVEIKNEEIILFVTWEQDIIDGKEKIYVNNCWIDKKHRKPNSLLMLRKIFRDKLNKDGNLWWHNTKRDKLVERV